MGGWEERGEGGPVTLELEIRSSRGPGREAAGRRVAQEAGTARAKWTGETARVQGNEEQERNTDSGAFAEMPRPSALK